MSNYRNSAPRRVGAVTRREFLKTTSALSLAGTATPFALNLASIGAAAAQTATDYKALVCLFLFGGNDHYNTVIPFDQASYDLYATPRATPPDPIARDRATLLEIAPTTSPGDERRFALPPELANLKAQFDQGKVAVVGNVGPLIVPTSKVQYQNASVPLPPKLFSHNDQQSVWQALGPEGAITGWGGRIGDLLLSQNTNSVFTCISATGNAVWLAGQQAVQYQISTSNTLSVPITAIGRTALFGSSAGPAALRRLATGGGANLFQQDHSTVVQRSITADQLVAGALAGTPIFTTQFPSTITVPGTTRTITNPLADQLRSVARMIQVRGALGTKRQVFFVSLGGFDTHDNLNDTQPDLLLRVDASINAFRQAMIELGVDNQVTLFTASDFGRTLTSNGDGSDHGWGSHHFVAGGAVNGKNIYGTMPVAALNQDTEVGQGRLLPTTSVDQYAATLAKWFGVSDANVQLVLPNLANFNMKNLGFV